MSDPIVCSPGSWGGIWMNRSIKPRINDISSCKAPVNLLETERYINVNIIIIIIIIYNITKYGNTNTNRLYVGKL